MIQLHSHQMNVLHDAIHVFGVDQQILKTIEELSELIKELCLFKSDSSIDRNRHNVAEELADVIVMVEQMLIVFNQDAEVTRQLRYKINRLDTRLMKESIMEKKNESSGSL